MPAFLLLLCLAPAEGPFAPPKWVPLFSGVELSDLQADKPRLMRGHAARIDLRAAGLSFLATPPNGDRPGDTDGLKTSTFLTRHRCQLAINAAPFAPIHKEEGQPQTIEGLTVSCGKLVSKERKGRPALLLAKDNRATIAMPPFDLKGTHNAVGGFQVVLQRGRVMKTNDAVHPRTAAGVTADGGTLYLLVIDGRQKDYSAGATTEEVGAWLKALGCSEGINLDGGGTTTLVVEGKDGKPRVLNRPIHGGKPGTERVSASHLGVFARSR
ncbi:MAG: phosphodiester glycosidase family protein [Gemmataceae bacterium]